MSALRESIGLEPASITTKRPVSPGAEAMIGVVHPVLDHGEVELMDYMGTDSMLCRVARVSTGSESQDLGLLNYLVRQRHTSPIEFAKIVLRVKLPIFLARQWIRHRTGSFSERSLRYQPPLDDAYVPAPDYVQGKPTKNKQGRGDTLAEGQAGRVAASIRDAGLTARSWYECLSRGTYPDADSDDSGIAPELARSVLPLGTYTEWYWTTDAHNLMHWLRLRLDSHAQKEIRAYGEVVMRIFEAWLPALAAAFRTYILDAVTLSSKEQQALGRTLRECDGLSDSTTDDLGMSAGEVVEFRDKMRRIEGAGIVTPIHGLIDCDGVLADFLSRFLAGVNDVTGQVYCAEHVSEWDIAKSLNLSPEVTAAARALVKRSGWCRSLSPYPDARNGVALIRQLGSVHILTSPWSGHPTWHPEREAWLQEHFDILSRDVTHTAAKDRFRGDYLIDDKPEHVVAWQAAHPNGLALLWDQPYNRNGWTHLNRARTWDEARNTILAWARQTEKQR